MRSNLSGSKRSGDLYSSEWDFEVVVNAASLVARPFSHSRYIQPPRKISLFLPKQV
jgi:hypothetical protein